MKSSIYERPLPAYWLFSPILLHWILPFRGNPGEYKINMASIRNRGDLQWEARIRHKGHSVQCKTFETKARAEAWARQIENEMDRGIRFPEGSRKHDFNSGLRTLHP